jgi:hypothetical protein
MSVHVCWTEPHTEVFRRSYGQRWCFVCRTRRDFAHVRMAPIDLSWYGPYDKIECPVCRTVDGDCFPGVEREWGDE